METNPAYGTTQSHDYEPTNGNQSDEYVYVNNGEVNKYAYANACPPIQENSQTEREDRIEEKQAKKSVRICQIQKRVLIAITVTLVITLLIAMTALATAIVALYALGQESINGVDQQRAHMEWAQQRFSELLAEDDSLKSQVDTLATQISAPMVARQFQNCTVETQICTIEPTNSMFYWRGCLTTPLFINEPDRFTMSMRCLYNRGQFMFESAQLIEREGTVFCSCSVLNPDPFGQGLRVLPIDLNGTCTLEITRCPL